MRNIYSWIVFTFTILLCFVINLPVQAAQFSRRPIECRIMAKLHESIQPIANSLTNLTVAEQFAQKLADDMKVLNLQDATLQHIQSQYADYFHEMSLILHNIREGQLAGASTVFSQMMPYYTDTAQGISATSQELNKYCKGVWGFQPIPE